MSKLEDKKREIETELKGKQQQLQNALNAKQQIENQINQFVADLNSIQGQQKLIDELIKEESNANE